MLNIIGLHHIITFGNSNGRARSSLRHRHHGVDPQEDDRQVCHQTDRPSHRNEVRGGWCHPNRHWKLRCHAQRDWGIEGFKTACHQVHQGAHGQAVWTHLAMHHRWRLRIRRHNPVWHVLVPALQRHARMSCVQDLMIARRLHFYPAWIIHGYSSRKVYGGKRRTNRNESIRGWQSLRLDLPR